MGRTQKSIKNIIFGIGAQIFTTVLAFVSKTVMVKMLGLEIVSLNGLFHEIVAALSLAELGIGSAIVFNLYKPLAENDENKVCELMYFFKSAYRIIALILFGLGTIVCIFVPLMVHDITFDNRYIREIFMLFVINTSTSYLFSYKISLLNADQRRYVYSFYNTILQTVKVILLLLLLALTKNYILYLCLNIVLCVLSNYIISKKVDTLYPYLKKAILPKEDRKRIFDNVKNIFIKELSGKITSSTDNMLISIMVSTIMVGKYSFYSTILALFKQLTEQVETGIKASMGNLFAKGTNEECERVLFRLTWGYCAFAVFCCVCLYSCCQSFISFWVGSEYLLGKTVLFILVINLFCYISSKPIYSAMHVSGFFVEGRNISIIGSVANLIVSIVIAYYAGIFGIFLGTFCTYFIQIVMKIYYVYKKKFCKSSFKYSAYMIQFSILLLVLMIGCDFICGMINTGTHLFDFFIKGVIAAIISILLMLLIYHRLEEYKYYRDLIFRFLKRNCNK